MATRFMRSLGLSVEKYQRNRSVGSYGLQTNSLKFMMHQQAITHASSELNWFSLYALAYVIGIRRKNNLYFTGECFKI